MTIFPCFCGRVVTQAILWCMLWPGQAEAAVLRWIYLHRPCLGVCLYGSLFQLRMVNIANKAMLTRFMLISFLFQVSLLLLETKMHFNENNNNSQTQPNIHKENKARIAVTFHYQSFWFMLMLMYPWHQEHYHHHQKSLALVMFTLTI